MDITRDEWNAHLERLNGMLTLADNFIEDVGRLKATVSKLEAEVMRDPETGRQSLREYMLEKTSAIQSQLSSNRKEIFDHVEIKTASIRSDIKTTRRWIITILTAMLLSIVGAAMAVIFRPYTTASLIENQRSAPARPYSEPYREQNRESNRE